MAREARFYPSILLALAAAACASDATAPPELLPPARIAFTVRYPIPDSMPLYTVLPDGSDLRLVLAGEGTRYSPTWAPDRVRIAFTYSPSGYGSRREIRIVNADGTAEHTILGPGRYFAPDWSANGSRIVLVRGDSGQTQSIITISPDGTDLTEIRDHLAFDDDPAWSPDGERIAFVSNCVAPGCSQAVRDLWVMNADGTDPRQLTAGVEIDDDAYEPTWSPDGTWIAFTMIRAHVMDVYRIKPSGTDLQRLTAGTPVLSYLSPTYSPDGEHLAYADWNGAYAAHLFVAREDASDPVLLPLAVGEPVCPTWAR